MAGFPATGTTTESGHGAQFADPGSLSLFVTHTKGPGRTKEERHLTIFLMNWKTWERNTRATRGFRKRLFHSRPAVPTLLRLSGYSRLLEAGASGTAKVANVMN